MNKRMIKIIVLVITFFPTLWGGYQIFHNLATLFTGYDPVWNLNIILFGLLFYLGWVPLFLSVIRSRKQ